MKKILLIVLISFLSFQGFSQNPELYQTWYLHWIEMDLGDGLTVSQISPTISPTLTIEPSFEFYGVGACNTFLGNFEYIPQTDELLSQDFIRTKILCEYEEHIHFELVYFDMLEYIVGYILSPDQEEGWVLILETQFPGFNLIFQDTPILSVSNFTETDIRLYPNPVQNVLYLENNSGYTLNTLKVYDVLGRLVLEENNPTKQLDVSSLASGLLFVHMDTDSGVIIKKVLKE